MSRNNRKNKTTLPKQDIANVKKVEMGQNELVVTEVSQEEESTKPSFPSERPILEESERLVSDESEPAIHYHDGLYFRDLVQKSKLSRLTGYIEAMTGTVEPKLAVQQHGILFQFIGFLLSADLSVKENIEDIRMAGAIVKIHADKCFSDTQIFRHWDRYLPRNRKIKDEAFLLISLFVRGSVVGTQSKPINWENFTAIVRPQHAEKYLGALRKAFGLK